MTDIFISSEYIKLDSFLKLCGEAGSGGTAKLIIADGAVCVNGEICLMRGKKLRPGDTVDVSGERYTIKAGSISDNDN